METLGILLGLLYIWLELRASLWLWPVGIVMPAVYTVVYGQAGLYADMGLQVYYILAGLYGLWAWRYRRTRTGNMLRIRHMPLTLLPRAVALFAATFLPILFVLTTWTDSTVPYADTFTTALSIVGLWLLARKYIEQWAVWAVVDAASAALYIYKELYLTAALYTLYTVLCVYGWRRWQRMADEYDTVRALKCTT